MWVSVSVLHDIKQSTNGANDVDRAERFDNGKRPCGFFNVPENLIKKWNTHLHKTLCLLSVCATFARDIVIATGLEQEKVRMVSEKCNGENVQSLRNECD